MTDIGTGSYTVIAQTAAEMMGVPLDKVRGAPRRLELSRCRAVRAGSGAATAPRAGVYAACLKLREAVAQKAGFNAADAVFADGQVRSGTRSVPLADVGWRSRPGRRGLHRVRRPRQAVAAIDFRRAFRGGRRRRATGETRVRRMLAVCAAGRILNPKTARSQVIGGMVMGVGAALMEELAVDKRLGFFVNHDLAGYEVPVHADIPHQEVIFLDETDPMSSPMKAKGVGELGICGAAAAVANAVYNATGVRVRDYPITLDKLLGGLPPLAV